MFTGLRTRLDGHRQRLRKHWYKHAHKIVVGGVGGTILFLGVLTVVTPIPTSLTLGVGFAVLGTEFLWAKRIIRRAKIYLKEQLPDTQSGRIDRLFAHVSRHSKHVVQLLHHHIVKPLTPRRKRAQPPEPVEEIPGPVKKKPV
jgi:tellurite resistance protein TerC